MHGGKKTTTNTAPSWEEVSGEVSAILVESGGKISSFQRYGEHWAEVKMEGQKGGGHWNAGESSFPHFLPVQQPGRKRQGRQQSRRVKLTGRKCCRGEQVLLHKLPPSLPLPGSSAWCRCALQHHLGVSAHAPKRNASIMKNLSTSRLNQQQT